MKAKKTVILTLIITFIGGTLFSIENSFEETTATKMADKKSIEQLWMIIKNLQNHVGKLKSQLDKANERIISLENRLLTLEKILTVQPTQSSTAVKPTKPTLDPDKALAKAWADGQITNAQFIQEIQNRLNDGKMKPFDRSSQYNYDPSQPIPSWIKNNAKWWAEGSIGDTDWRSGLDYLYDHGFLRNP
jgi:hypothetical protein